jgi:S-adenosylmethionine hydrolase
VRLTRRLATPEEVGSKGDVVGLDDPYGSLITDISGDDFKKLGHTMGEKVTIRIGKKFYTMLYVRTFADV